jgi:hypothetical protein
MSGMIAGVWGRHHVTTIVSAMPRDGDHHLQTYWDTPGWTPTLTTVSAALMIPRRWYRESLRGESAFESPEGVA